MSLSRLWEEYAKNKTSELRNEIVKEYTNFVSYLVGRVVAQLPPGLTREDLFQFGVFGLIGAVEKFDPQQGAKFETYASWKIKGAIVDQIRYYGKTSGGLSRSARVKLKNVEEAVRRLESRHARHPSSEEVAAELEMTMDEYYKTLGEISFGVPISLDEMVGQEENIPMSQVIKNEKSSIPEEEVLLSENNELLAKAIEELPPKERFVLEHYYYQEMTLKEIGEAMNLSESRISQLHTQAVIRLRNKLTGGD